VNAVKASGPGQVGQDPDYAEETSMSRISQLIVAWSGPAMIVTFIIGGCIMARYLPPQWHPSDSPQKVAQIYIDHLMPIRIGLVLSVIAYTMMAVWGVSNAAQTRRLEGKFPALTYLQLVCMAAGTAQIVVNCGAWATAAFRPGQVSPEITQALNDMGFIILLGTWPPFTAWSIALGLQILLNKSAVEVYPRWAGYVSIWCGLLYMPGGTVWFFKGGPFGWTGAICMYVPFVFFGSWIGLFSVLTIRNIRAGHVERQELAPAT
jgi:hypothetical protein